MHYQRHTVQDLKKGDNTIAYLLPSFAHPKFCFFSSDSVYTPLAYSMFSEVGQVCDSFLSLVLPSWVYLTSTLSSDGTGLNHCVCKGS